MKILDLVTFVLVIIGALNWTLYGLMDINLVGSIFGASDVLVKVVYTLIGLSGMYMITHYKDVTHEQD